MKNILKRLLVVLMGCSGMVVFCAIFLLMFPLEILSGIDWVLTGKTRPILLLGYLAAYVNWTFWDGGVAQALGVK